MIELNAHEATPIIIMSNNRIPRLNMLKIRVHFS